MALGSNDLSTLPLKPTFEVPGPLYERVAIVFLAKCTEQVIFGVRGHVKSSHIAEKRKNFHMERRGFGGLDPIR